MAVTIARSTVREFTFHWALDPITKWRSAQIGGALEYVLPEQLVEAGLPAEAIAAWQANRPALRTGGPAANAPVWLGHSLIGFADVFPDMALDEAAAWVVVVDAAGQNMTQTVQAWLPDFPTGGWRYVAAGLTVAEAVTARVAGTLPDDEQVKVLAGLRGMAVPLP